MIRRCNKGFTLLELAISMSVMVVAVLAMVGLFITYSALIETSKNTAAALSEAQAVVEALRNTEPFTAAGVSANYPQGVDLASVFNFNKLKNESIFITYGSLSADPLQVTVTVSWQDRTRSRSESLTTLMTQR